MDKNKYYTEITQTDFQNPTVFLLFSKTELNRLITFCKNESLLIQTGGYIVQIFDRKSFYVLFELIKLEDEWYMANSRPLNISLQQSFFKCDQFEGLLKYLSDYLPKR